MRSRAMLAWLESSETPRYQTMRILISLLLLTIFSVWSFVGHESFLLGPSAPGHSNFDHELRVYPGPYEYASPEVEDDYLPQTSKPNG